MCGIAVVVDVTGGGAAEPWALEVMRHRGPDGEGLLRDTEGRAVLEHCRLAILDPENPEAGQPFTDRSGRWAIVHNGEVFNFRELRAEYERRGVSFRTDSDTEVVLEAFIRDGDKVLDRLRGMFAFAVWDRETGELFAARDPLGVKPLYYAMAGGRFVAASELRTVLAHPAVPRVIDPAGVIEHLAFGHASGERTLIEGVRKLPPGHALRLKDGRLRVFEYWDVLPLQEQPPSAAEAGDELLELLEAAVAAALVSDVPLGLMLSGGLDSGAVAALAVRHVDASALTGYSVAFDRPDDEAAVAARLARDLGLSHRVVRLSRDRVEDELDAWLSGIDAPSSDPTWVAVSFIARAAREDGIKVLLSGDGGDELFGGYNRWMRYLRFHDRVWGRIPSSVKRPVGRLARPFLRGLAGDIARRAAEGGELFVGSRPLHDDVLARLLGPRGREAADAIPPESGVRALRERFEERLPGGDELSWMSYLTLKTHLVENYLGRLDKMGMRESVEGRVPLLDHELARWAFRIPQRLKVEGYEQKALFRRTVAGLLPPYILSRRKHGFCPPVGLWATRVLRERPGLGPAPLADAGLVGTEAAREVLAGRSGGPFASWTLGTLLAWCHRNL